MKLTDQLFKRKLDEAEKEFTFTEFLNLVDRCMCAIRCTYSCWHDPDLMFVQTDCLLDIARINIYASHGQQSLCATRRDKPKQATTQLMTIVCILTLFLLTATQASWRHTCVRKRSKRMCSAAGDHRKRPQVLDPTRSKDSKEPWCDGGNGGNTKNIILGECISKGTVLVTDIARRQLVS